MSTGEYTDGTVYILHLDPQYKHARHYTGYAEPGCLAARLAAHAAGRGARLMQVIKAAGGSFRLAVTFPGDRDLERRIKDSQAVPRFCPECSPAPRVSMPNVTPRWVRRKAREAQPTVAPRVGEPRPVRPPSYERGAASARLAVQRQIDAGFSADRIAEVQWRIFAALIPERAGHEGREEARGYRETAMAMIAAHREATTPQPTTAAQEAAAQPREGTEMNTDSAPGTLPARPATEWMKGARTAHDLIVRQVEAGHSADRIAERWDEALATYDDTAATPDEREWHAGAEETARDMIQTWRELERAEAEQEQADRDQHQAGRDQRQVDVEAELEAG